MQDFRNSVTAMKNN